MLDAKYGLVRGGGAPLIFLDRMGSGYGSLLVEGGICSLVTQDSSLVTGQGSAFEMRSGVAPRLSRRYFLVYTTWLGIRRLPLQIIWICPVAPTSGMSVLFDWYMIGKWKF